MASKRKTKRNMTISAELTASGRVIGWWVWTVMGRRSEPGQKLFPSRELAERAAKGRELWATSYLLERPDLRGVLWAR